MPTQTRLKEQNVTTIATTYDNSPASARLASVTNIEDKQATKDRAVLRAASGSRIKGVRWLYEGRIPVGMMTLLAGREGIGKSTVSLDIAARITRGELPGRMQGTPRNVIICATEDSWEVTILPRLMSVGADLDRIFHIAIQTEDGKERPIEVPRDIRRIEEGIADVDPALLLIDPMMAALGSKVDTHKQQEVQEALLPLVALCDRTNMAVVGLIHVNKNPGTDPLNSLMGSKAFATVPRSVLYCIADEDTEGEYLMTHAKCNVGPKQPTLKYRVQSVEVELAPEDVEEGDDSFVVSSRVIWGGEDERSATDVLAASGHSPNLGSTLTDVLNHLVNEGLSTVKDIEAALPQYESKGISAALTRLKQRGLTEAPSRGNHKVTAAGTKYWEDTLKPRSRR